MTGYTGADDPPRSARADAARALVRSERFPQLFGSASYDRTLKSEFEGLFDAEPDPGDGDDGGGGDLDFSNLPFGQANVYRIGDENMAERIWPGEPPGSGMRW